MTTLSVILAFFGSHCETLRSITQGGRMGVIATLFIVIASPFHPSLRAEHMAIPMRLRSLFRVKRGISCSSLLRLRLATANAPRNDKRGVIASLFATAQGRLRRGNPEEQNPKS